LVTNYSQLVVARIAAAVGEAGCKPPTYSLLGDYFPEPAARTRAMAVYWLGSPLGALISYVAGGWLNERYSWRMTFLILGIPGLLLAAVVKLTIAEPRAACASQHPVEHSSPSLRAVLGVLWQQRTLRHLSAALILLYAMGAGMGPWYAAFMIRIHGMSTGELGVWLGVIFGLSGAVGTLLGGYIANRWFAEDLRGQTCMSAIGVALLMPAFVAFLLVPQRYEALIALTPIPIVFCLCLAPTYALMQRLVPDDMRATTLAVVMLLANLIGMGVGPQIVGILSDALTPFLGRDALRFAMLMLSATASWAAFHFWQASRFVVRDLGCPA
jgi:MFS family permease